MTREQDVEGTREFGRSVDFGKTASDYRRHRAGFPEEFFDALVSRQWVRSGFRALDLGTGTGTVARGLAEKGASVTGLDPSAALMEQAVELDAEAGVQVEYLEGRAEQVRAADGTFDVVTAGQCWHWFDGPVAAREVARVLKPGGRVVIAHFDWVPLAGNVVDATEELILRYNPAWTMGGGTGLYPRWLKDLGEAGFRSLETFSYDIPQPYSHAAWRGRIRASAGIKASLDADATARFDAELARVLAKRFPGDPLQVPHRVWVASGVRG